MKEIFIEEGKYLKDTLLDKTINHEGKLVIFSESKETTKYLYDALKNLLNEGIDVKYESVLFQNQLPH